MNKVQIFGKVAGTVMKTGGAAMLKCKQYSPELLLAGGIICGVAAVVTAIVETKKACKDEVLEEIEQELNDLDQDLKEINESMSFTDEEKKEERKNIRRELLKAYWKKARRIARLYAIPFALAVAMVVMGLASHGIIRGRYLSTVAAYTALDNSYQDYRQRIRDIAGDEAEQRFFDGTDEIEIKEKDPETGKTVKTKVNKLKENVQKRYSPYEFDFNRSTAPLCSTGNSDHDRSFLIASERTMQQLLEGSAKGYILLIDALEDIGIQVRDSQTGKLLVDPKLGWEKGDQVGYGISNYFYTDDPIQEARSGNASHHLCMNAHMLPFLV